MQESLSTPLTQAAEDGNLQYVQKLLQDIDPKRRFEAIHTEGIAALNKARANGHKDIVNLLLVEIVKEFETVAKAGDLNKVQSLINSFETRSDKQMLMDNISPDIIVNVAAVNQVRILHAMLKAASIKRRKELLCHNNFAPFYKAIKCEHNKMVEFILRVISKKSKQELIVWDWVTAFNWALLTPEGLKHFEPLFKELGPDYKQIIIKHQEFSIFKFCVDKGYIQLIRLFLQEIDPNDKQAMISYRDHSAFYWAVTTGCVELVELLLKEIAPNEKRKMLEAGRLAAFDHRNGRTIKGKSNLVVSMRVIELLLQEAEPIQKKEMLETAMYYCGAEVFRPVRHLLLPLIEVYCTIHKVPFKLNLNSPDGSPEVRVTNRVTVYQELITQGIYTGLEVIVNQKAILKLVCSKTENMFSQLATILLSHVFSFLDINDFSPAVVAPASLLSLRSKVQLSSAPKSTEETRVSLLDKFIGEMTMRGAATGSNAQMLSSASLLAPVKTPAVSHLNSVQFLDQFILEMEQSIGNGRSL